MGKTVFPNWINFGIMYGVLIPSIIGMTPLWSLIGMPIGAAVFYFLERYLKSRKNHDID